MSEPAETRAAIQPVDIDLSVPGALPEGCYFARLRSAGDLAEYWNARPAGVRFAARREGLVSGPTFLRLGEWVFATTPEGLIAAVTRWKALGISTTWYDWKADPNASLTRDEYVADVTSYRAARLADGEWSAEEEAQYLVNTSTEGYWVLTNLPGGLLMSDWLEGLDVPDVDDPSLGPDAAARQLMAITYDAWHDNPAVDIRVLTDDEVVEDINYWLAEEREGGNHGLAAFEEYMA